MAAIKNDIDWVLWDNLLAVYEAAKSIMGKESDPLSGLGWTQDPSECTPVPNHKLRALVVATQDARNRVQWLNEGRKAEARRRTEEKYSPAVDGTASDVSPVISEEALSKEAVYWPPSGMASSHEILRIEKGLQEVGMLAKKLDDRLDRLELQQFGGGMTDVGENPEAPRVVPEEITAPLYNAIHALYKAKNAAENMARDVDVDDYSMVIMPFDEWQELTDAVNEAASFAGLFDHI